MGWNVLVTAGPETDLKGKLSILLEGKLTNQRSVPKEQSVIREVKGKVTKISGQVGRWKRN